MFTKEELAELEMFDREVDNEDQLRSNEQKRRSKARHKEKVKAANRAYYLKNSARIRARRKERWHTYEKYHVKKKSKQEETVCGEKE